MYASGLIAVIQMIYHLYKALLFIHMGNRNSSQKHKDAVFRVFAFHGMDCIAGERMWFNLE
jgi:heme/copper-type cytochrome/quinol oxidase subunit 4